MQMSAWHARVHVFLSISIIHMLHVAGCVIIIIRVLLVVILHYLHALTPANGYCNIGLIIPNAESTRVCRSFWDTPFFGLQATCSYTCSQMAQTLQLLAKARETPRGAKNRPNYYCVVHPVMKPSSSRSTPKSTIQIALLSSASRRREGVVERIERAASR